MGIFDYCERALRLSRAQAYYFKSVAEKSEEIPELKAAIDQGDVSLSQARRIIPVVTKENQQHWIAEAKSLPRAELERRVTAVNPNAQVREKIRPVANELLELKTPIDRETEENLRVLQNVLSQKLGKPASLSQVIGWTARICREKFDLEKRARQAVSSGKTVATKLEQHNVRTGRHPVTQQVKHQVIYGNGLQCSYISGDGRRCESRRWLDLHHLKMVRDGGLNVPENLQVLCKAHHRLAHQQPHPLGPKPHS